MTNPASPPLAPVAIPSRQDSPWKTPSSPSAKASSSPISVSSHFDGKELSASDKEREKLLYPGRVLLTSKSIRSVISYCQLGSGNPSCSGIVIWRPCCMKLSSNRIRCFFCMKSVFYVNKNLCGRSYRLHTVILFLYHYVPGLCHQMLIYFV
jgi:hypothetical protein